MNPDPQATPHQYDANARPRRYFISDLHLDGQDSPHALKFRVFLQRLAREGQDRPIELYILGDLFEFWYEYRAQIFELYAADLAALEKAWQAGVQIYLFYGNRDFAYGPYVTRRFGGTVLGDGQQITLTDSRPAWLEHGDLLCTADRRYLRFRSFIRSWPVRLCFWLMPWSWARATIERLRRRTAADKKRKPADTMQIDADAARRRLEARRCKLLICGHLHRALGQDLGAGFRLIVLPAWRDEQWGMRDDEKGFREFRT